MAAHKYGLQLDDADLIDTIETLTEQGETIAGNGGVLPARVAEELPFAPKTIAKHCSQLAEAGRLQAAWGFHNGQQRKSYLPADDEDDQALVTDGGVEQPADDSEYATDVDIEHRDDGYVAVKTHEDSAMGRRVLLLKPAELENLRQELQADDQATPNGGDHQ